MRLRSRFLPTAVASLLLLAPAIVPAAEPAKCKLVRIAEWPVSLQNGLPIIEGRINGKPVGVLLDTGAYASLITKPSAEKLDLLTRATPEVVIGVGGRSQVLMTRLEELTIAGSTRKGLRVRVGGERAIPGVDFILGDDFFRVVDMEFDYAKGVIRLWQAIDCHGQSLAYWGGAHQLPIEGEGKIVLPVKVNGRDAHALLDSGASASAVSLPFAERVGIRVGGPEIAPGGCTTGLGADAVRQWIARFDSIEVGNQVIRDARLRIADYMPELAYGSRVMPEVILGTDFLKAHRVYVSRSQRKAYFTYQGGLIFPSTPHLDCDEESFGKGAGELRAAYDRAIAQNPRDVQALVRRGSLRWREGAAKEALPDLDAAIRIEPANAYALVTRASVRQSLQDYHGALADSEAAIANGMRRAEVFHMRGGLRRSLEDYPGAIEEYDRALELDPRYLPSLRVRGRYNYHLGRLESAEKDYASAMAIRPSGLDAIWLSLIRTRRGLDGKPVLEQELARTKDAAWPAPVMQYLLGNLDRPGLMVQAALGDEEARPGQLCEANYYAAARLLIAGDSATARPLLQKAVDECPTNYREYDSALVEMKGMR